jgi:hypothetical protein
MKKLIHSVLKVQTYFYIKVGGPYTSSNIQILLINLLIDKIHGAQSFENITVTQVVKKFLPFMQTMVLLPIPNNLPRDAILRQLISVNTSALYCYKIHLKLSSNQYPRSLLHTLQV